jgi:CheY-like chemotaxis protein
VLVADDLPDAADALVGLLRLAGYDAVAAYDGRQAVETARTFAPDLAILDIDMPGLDGYEAARRLRQEQRPGSRLVLIAHTGRTTPADVQMARDAGFDRHLPKPSTGTELCNLVAAFLAADREHSAEPSAAKAQPPVDASRPLDGRAAGPSAGGPSSGRSID